MTSKIVKLNSKNYAKWRSAMKRKLNKIDAWDVVLTQPTGQSKDWALKNARATELIITNVDDGQLQQVGASGSAFDLWKKLGRMYPEAVLGLQVETWRQICSIKFKEKTDIGKHIQQLEAHFNELAIMGKRLDETMRIWMLLASLPDSMSEKITNTDGTAKPLTMESVKAQLENLCKHVDKPQPAPAASPMPSSSTGPDSGRGLLSYPQSASLTIRGLSPNQVAFGTFLNKWKE